MWLSQKGTWKRGNCDTMRYTQKKMQKHSFSLHADLILLFHVDLVRLRLKCIFLALNLQFYLLFGRKSLMFGSILVSLSYQSICALK